MDHSSSQITVRSRIGTNISRSTDAYLRETRVVPGGSMRQASWFAPHPPYAAGGQGCWIRDLDGGRILDCANNFFSLVHGHAFAPVLEVLDATMRNGTAFGLPTELEIRLAEVLAGRSPAMEQTRFCNSGTEAVMNAIKGARGLTDRHRIAKFEGCYHGSYDYIEVSLEPDPTNWDDADGDPAAIGYSRGVSPSVVAETVILPYDDPQRCEDILRRHGDTLAAVILDPHASRAGMVPMGGETISVVQAACRRHGIMLIADEVICYRLSAAGASPLFGIEPDFVTLAKIIGGGLPVGGVSGPADRMNVFDHASGKARVVMGGTFNANPMSMAAGIVALDHLDAAAIDRLNAMGERLRSRVRAGLGEAGVAWSITGLGSLFRLHACDRGITGFRSAYPVGGEAAAIKRVHSAMLADSILLTPNCSGALSTPMGEAEIDHIAERLVFHAAASRAH
ncbi:Glutamate-1-semialdehyde 2,1-aminomutase [Aquamicrobium terrae]